MIPDEHYADLARKTREALRVLGSIVRECLPGEPDACGHGYLNHYVANVAGITAIIYHSLGHVDHPGAAADFVRAFAAAMRDVDKNCPEHKAEQVPQQRSKPQWN